MQIGRQIDRGGKDSQQDGMMERSKIEMAMYGHVPQV